MAERFTTFGYARVSSRDQNLDRQLIALKNFPVNSENIFVDKASGKDFDRTGYHQLTSIISKGDLLVIKSIDRLGRNYDEIINQWKYITRDLGADIAVIDMPALDTRASQHGITSTFVSDIFLQVMSYVAQVERENIRQRQAEGLAAAKARGVQFGRPPIPICPNFDEVNEAFKRGEITRDEAARKLGISHSTFDSWRKKAKTCDAPTGSTSGGANADSPTGGAGSSNSDANNSSTGDAGSSSSDANSSTGGAVSSPYDSANPKVVVPEGIDNPVGCAGDIDASAVSSPNEK